MPVPAEHFTLGQLIQREYGPLFFTDPLATKVDDYGYSILDSLWGTDFGGDPVVYGLFLQKEGVPLLDIAGCGTRTDNEWLMDALAFLVQVPWAPVGVKAHSGFLGLTDSLRTSQGIPVVDFVAGRPSRASGHSLFAAVATMLAAKLGSRELVGIASPRVWNQQGADWAETRVQKKAIYLRSGPDEDIVTCLPPVFPEPFRHQQAIIHVTGATKLPTESDRHSIPEYLAAMALLP